MSIFEDDGFHFVRSVVRLAWIRCTRIWHATGIEVIVTNVMTTSAYDHHSKLHYSRV